MTRAFWLAWLAALALLLSPRGAAAHESGPGALALRERAKGHFTVQWMAPLSEQSAIEPEFPAHCRLRGPELDCGAAGLSGTVGIRGLEGTLSRVVVHIAFRDGSSNTATLSADSPRIVVKASAMASREQSALGVAREYVAFGVEHILLGLDHLLFVLGLLLLVRFGKQLIWTISAFTLAHSVTLACAVLGAVQVPQAPVEAVIALSILLLAVECARPFDSLSRRLPWVVAFSFGLLHGFGFAGALSEVGLPHDQLPLALVCFNVGVEIGQLAVVSVAWLVSLAAARWQGLARPSERLLVYVMGSLAAYWSIERLLASFAS